MHGAGRSRHATVRPRFEVGDLIREHRESLLASEGVTPEQGKVLRDLARCRTPALGGHLDRCSSCGHERPAYNSCRNRHCPKCQSLEQHRWLEKRMQTLLPIPYFHVVFTLPSELAPLVLLNRRRLYDLLFRAASRTLLALGRDPKRLGAQLGATMVLHTWTRDLRIHPHVHAIVTGGGLSPDQKRWVASGQRHLFPVRVISKLFRGKVLAGLRDLHARRPLRLPDDLDEHTLRLRISELYRKRWVTYAKRPFAGPEQVLRYLGHYTHRVGLSNHRLLDVSRESVTLRTRGRDSVDLEPQLLLRRFLLHVLPPGFVRIRHYGLLASTNLRTRLPLARNLLGVAQPRPSRPPSWETLLEQLSGIRTDVCPRCGSVAWVRRPLDDHDHPPRPPPEKGAT